MSNEYDPYTEWFTVQQMILFEESENIMAKIKLITNKIELLEFERDIESSKLATNSKLFNKLKNRYSIRESLE